MTLPHETDAQPLLTMEPHTKHSVPGAGQGADAVKAAHRAVHS